MTTLVAGDRFPKFALTASDGTRVTDAGFAGRSAVFFFYPRADTPGCTKEARAFTELADAFAAADTALLGISRDPPPALAKFTEKHALGVPLASDSGPEFLSDRLGIWSEKKNYGHAYMGMVRTTFWVGGDGVIRRVWPRVRVPGHAEAVLDAVVGFGRE